MNTATFSRDKQRQNAKLRGQLSAGGNEVLYFGTTPQYTSDT
jgi:hypothetical protein